MTTAFIAPSPGGIPNVTTSTGAVMAASTIAINAASTAVSAATLFDKELKQNLYLIHVNETKTHDSYSSFDYDVTEIDIGLLEEDGALNYDCIDDTMMSEQLRPLIDTKAEVKTRAAFESV